MNKLFNITDRIIVITGATGVLCGKMAEYLALEGATVVLLGRSKEKGKAIESRIVSKGGKAIFLETDVTNIDKLKENEAKIISRYGKIDVLINGAGGNMPGATIPPDKTFFDIDMDAIRGVIDLNLYGTMLPTLIFSKNMAERKEGVILNISSASALRPITRVAGYGMAKAAISNLTKYLAGEFASKFGDKIRVNALVPGFFITEQNRTLLTNPDGSYTERANKILDHTPFRRFGEAEELLGSVHWLVSDASKFVTGTMTIVDGGFDAYSI